MPDKSVSEIIAEIKAASGDELNQISKQLEDLTNKISVNLTQLAEVASDYRKKIEQAKTEWTAVQHEVEVLKNRKSALASKEEKLNDRIKEVDKQEADLLGLHKALKNKGESLEAREKKIKDREYQLGTVDK